MPTITVLDADGLPQAIEKPNVNGRQLALNSRPVALATEDAAVLDASRAFLETIATLLGLPLQAEFSTFPGYKPGDIVPISDGQAKISWTQTVVTGSGTAATVLTANANRKGVVFLPAGAANDWIYNFFGIAAAGASPIYPPAGGPFVLLGRGCPTSALSMLGTASQKIVVWEGV